MARPHTRRRVGNNGDAGVEAPPLNRKPSSRDADLFTDRPGDATRSQIRIALNSKSTERPAPDRW
jgi:hypothetical protein